ncbi:aldose reductase-like [Sarcoptes scabiei]|nr:aldose reductase-like [Sarcoptes scabiei]
MEQKEYGISRSFGAEFYDCLERIRFNYPYYRSPFRVQLNPNYSERLNRECNEWAINLFNHHHQSLLTKSTIESINGSDLGLFSARTFPSAERHRLKNLMKWCFIFFLIDDYHDALIKNKLKDDDRDNNSFWNQIIKMLDSILHHRSLKAEWPEFIQGIYSLLKDIYSEFNPNQIDRSIRMFKHYVNGNKLEILLPSSSTSSNGYGKIDGFSEWHRYLKARKGSIGSQMTMQLIEYAHRIELSDYQWNHPLIQSLIENVSIEMILLNDYLTFRKEIAENEYKFSRMKHSFTILVNQGLNLQQAVDEIHRMILEYDSTIMNLIENIRKDCGLNLGLQTDSQLNEFLIGVEEVLGGSWEFLMTSPRYHGKGFKGRIPMEGSFQYDPHRTIILDHNHNYDDT